MTVSSSERGAWGSRLGFILAAAGSAIGLGNVWRFPTMAGKSGGAAFVLIYLLCVLFIGLPVLLAELTVGRCTQKNPVGAFERLAPETGWKGVGALGVLTGVVILSYYSVVAGWTIGYIFETLAGTFNDIQSPDVVTRAFTGLIGNPVVAIGLHAVFMALTMFVVLGGVQGGIERWTKILMPVLFLILILLVIRSVTLDGAERGLTFYLKPDFSEVTGTTFLNAMGQAFFSLSLGMGAMITYGSYLSRRDDLVSSAVWVSLADTLIAVLAGFAIFPALFTIPGLEPTEGAGLVFLVLPNIFDKIPGGLFFGAGFFTLLAIAALTSSISLLEVVVAYFIDEKGWTRRKAVTVLGGVAFLLGIPSALGNGAVASLSRLPLVNQSFLDFMDMLFGNFSLTIGALLLSLFVGWRWGTSRALEEIRLSNPGTWFGRLWAVLIRFLCPLAIGAILVNLILETI